MYSSDSPAATSKMFSATCVDDFLNKAFYKIGLVVGKHPGYFIIVPVLLTCICFTGYQKINYEIDPEYLFSPINGPGKHERAIVESQFHMNYSKYFNLGRVTRPGRFGHIIVVPKDGDPNILRSSVWKELKLLDSIINNVTAVFENESFTYSQICARWLEECSSNNILKLDYWMKEFETGISELSYPLFYEPKSETLIVLPVFFGGTILKEDSDFVKSVGAIQLGYFIVVDTPRQNAIGLAWEEAFLRDIGRAEESGVFEHISVARFASRTLELEFEANTQTIIPYFASTFSLMAIFSIVTCMMTDWVRSKPWLGLLGNISAGMATVAAFGLCCYLGIDFIGINLAAPFLMIGIGIDDTFVMLAAWRRTNIMDPVPLRMAHTLSEAAVSITITSVTDMVSFFIGVISPFPSVQIFCIYSGCAVIFTFLFHLSFFSGCVAISGYCEQKNLHSVICCPIKPLSKSAHRSWIYRIFCTGGVNPDDPNNPMDNPEHGCMIWFRDYLAWALNQSFVKVMVILFFGIYFAVAVYGLTTIKEGLDRRKLSKEDSYSIIFYDREDFYFREYPYRVQVIISGQYNYSDPLIQILAENLTHALESSKYIGNNSEYTHSWLRRYLYRLDSENLQASVKNNETAFIQMLKIFMNDEDALDLKFDVSGDRIVASRFLIQAVNVSGTNQEKEMVKELRRICAESPLNASVFHPYFVFFDQFELVLPTSIQSMIYGAITMMIISFIFIPNILCSFWVAFCIISIELGVAGFMALWDVSLDSISMINLIMCIGFSVDFTAHICYAYMSSKKNGPEERVKECLYTLGLPIVQGALSTILGITALLLAGTYIFLVFFKMVFLVIFIGAVHGLLLLPVLLSLFGPGSFTSRESEACSHKKSSKELSKIPQPYVIPHPTLFYPDGKVSGPIISLYTLEERDIGLGTSEDSNSTESGSFESKEERNLNKQRTQSQKYHKDWSISVRVLQNPTSQFQVVPLDYSKSAVRTQQLPCNYKELTKPSTRILLKNVKENYSLPDHHHKRNLSVHDLNKTSSGRYLSNSNYL